MFKIRKSVFETNSSSMHSLVVVKHPKPYNKEELELNCYRTDREYSLFGWSSEDCEFGRHPFRILRTPVEKLQYYVAHELGNCERYEKIPEIKQFISKYTGVPFDKVELRVTEHGKKCDYYGYIEHNDTGESPFEYLGRHKTSMEEFVLNPKYVVIVDGDEYCEFKKLFESNVLNADDFEDISSGADFWNDAEQYFYLGWLREDSWGGAMTAVEAVDKVSEFTKRFAVEVTSDTYKFYDPEFFREVCRLAKEKNPNIITIIRNDHYDSGKITQKQIDQLDTSMFDQNTLHPTKKKKEED